MAQELQRHWYAVYTRPRNEKKVRDRLQRKGVEVYLPIRTQIRQWSDRRKKVDMPIISSYLFVRIVYLQERQILYDTPGFVTFVYQEGRPKAIPESEIETMRRTVDSMLNFVVETKLLTRGQKVTIGSGPLCGIKGVITELSKNKVNILLETIGVTLVTDIEDAQLLVLK